MNTSPATTLYDRIEAALNLGEPNSVIREIRVVLENLFKQLTRFENRSFSNLYARTEFVYDKLQVKPVMQEQINSLRILSNKVSHEHDVLKERQYLLCIKTICDAVNYFYETPIPAQLQHAYARVAGEKFVRPAFKEIELIPLLKPVVLEVQDLLQVENGTRHFTIRCRDENIGEFFLQLWQTEHNDLSRLQPLLQPFDTIHVLNCKKTAGKDNHHSSVKDTQVILEPDILIDISELAECVQGRLEYPLLAIIKRLVPQDYNQSAFQGNMVNALLDAAIRQETPEFIPAFKEAVADNVLQAAAYGRDVLNQIYQTIKGNHWKNVMNVADTYRHQPTRIEPTFFSALYGLQGRLDLLVEDATDPLRKEIIELKSGKPPDLNTWRNHEMQVVGYNLLLRSTFGKNRTGASGILYSAAAEDALRDVVSNAINENRLLLLRNEVVYYLLQLAQARMDVLSTISIAQLSGLPSFMKADIQQFHDAYSAAGSLEKKYYHHFLCFIIREWLHEKCGMYAQPDREEDGDGFAALWLQSEEEKCSNFSIITGLQFRNYTTEGAVVAFTMDDPDLQHNFRPGDTALLYRRLGGALRPLEQQILKGRVDSIHNGELIFSLNNRQLGGDYFEKAGENWIIEHDIFETNNWVVTRSLFSVLLPANRARFQLLMGLKEPISVARPLPLAIANDASLNENQRTVIKKALEAEDYFLVQGPPGTGKTSMLLPRLVQGLATQPGAGSIVIVAFTNRAVEEIASRLEKQQIAFLRLGSRRSESEQRLRQYCTEGKIDAAREYIQQHKVFLATVTTMAGRINSLRQLKSDLNTLIVDESSQLTEPQLLSLVMDMKKFILVGDQNQLPPVVAIHEAFCQVEDAELKAAGINDLRTALFERLFLKTRKSGWDHASDMLTTHFRMHEDIAKLINHWYADKLQSGHPYQKVSLELDGQHAVDGEDAKWGKILSSGRTIFLPSEREAVSKYHRQEAALVVSLLRYLKKYYGDSFDADKVGVVTPWRTQIGLIRNLIGKDEALQQLNIDTVERFQGSENDVIIVSLAIYSAAQLNLLTSSGKYPVMNGDGLAVELEVDRKLLVTLSRARKQVVVLGYEPALRGSEHYKRILEKK